MLVNMSTPGNPEMFRKIYITIDAGGNDLHIYPIVIYPFSANDVHKSKRVSDTLMSSAVLILGRYPAVNMRNNSSA